MRIVKTKRFKNTLKNEYFNNIPKKKKIKEKQINSDLYRLNNNRKQIGFN